MPNEMYGRDEPAPPPAPPIPPPEDHTPIPLAMLGAIHLLIAIYLIAALVGTVIANESAAGASAVQKYSDELSRLAGAPKRDATKEAAVERYVRWRWLRLTMAAMSVIVACGLIYSTWNIVWQDYLVQQAAIAVSLSALLLALHLALGGSSKLAWLAFAFMTVEGGMYFFKPTRDFLTGSSTRRPAVEAEEEEEEASKPSRPRYAAIDEDEEDLDEGAT